MPRQDTVDFLTAFAVGTVIGIGATLLLQPDRSPRTRIVRQIKPYRKQLRKSYKDVSRGFRSGSDATSELTSEIIGAGRELLGEFRAEVADILEQARSELGDIVSQQVDNARKGARRTRRRIGL
jgi:gas vesicle protein